jgi:hypothetical protein
MQLFGHHISLEIFGTEFAPESTLEHVMAFGITGVVLALTIYGAYAAIRDLRRWLRRERQQPLAPRS